MMSTLVRLSGTWQFSLTMVVIQITFVVFGAWILNRFLCKQPSEKHVVWLLAFGVLSILVPLKWIVPSVNWQVARSSTTESIDPTSYNSEAKTPVALPSLVTSSPNQSGLIDQPKPLANVPDQSVNQESPAKQFVTKLTGKNESATTTTPWSKWLDSILWLNAFLTIYLTVATALGVRLVLACIRLRSIRNTHELTAANKAMAETIATQVALADTPRLLVHPQVASPMSFGIQRPTVALPLAFESWDEPTQRMVLAHEFNHIKRRDAWWDLLANLISIAYWFHPAVHFAKNRLRDCRELATDQQTISMGFPPADYARTLIQVAVNLPDSIQRNCVAIPMAGTRELTDRVKTVLASESLVRTNPQLRFLQRATWLAVFVFGAGLSLQFTIAKPSHESLANQEFNPLFPNERPEEEVNGTTFYERVEQTALRNREDDGNLPKVDIAGTVTGLDGKPIQAIVIVRNGHAMTSPTDKKINCMYAKTRTDEQGNYEFKQLNISKRYVDPEVVAFAESGEMAWKPIHNHEKASGLIEVDLAMEKSATLNGIIADEQNQPVTGAKIQLRSFRRLHESGRGIEYVGFNDRLIAPELTTDASGQFQFPNLPADVAISLTVIHPEFPPYFTWMSSSDVIIKSAKTWEDELEVSKSGSSIKLDSGTMVTGQVKSSDGSPVPGAKVEFGHMGITDVTDERGKFSLLINSKWPSLKETTFRIRVTHKDFADSTHRVTGEGLKSDLNIELSRPATIKGRVLADDLKTPIPDVALLISSVKGSNRVVSTDENGEFEWQVAPGSTQIRMYGNVRGYHLRRDERDINSGERARMTRDFSVSPGEVKLLEPFVLERIPQLEIEVVDDKGEAVRNASVSLISPGQFQNYEDNAKPEPTAMDGVATIDPWNKPSQGTIAIAKTKINGKSFWGESIVDLENGRARIALLPTVVATGKVTKNGKPLSRVQVRVSLDLPNETIDGLHRQRALSHYIATVMTNENGVYSLGVPQRDAADRRSIISVGIHSGIPNPEAGGVARRMKFTEEKYEQNIEFYEGDYSIRGKVVNDQQQPVAGIPVYIARQLPVDREGWEPRFRLYQPTMVYTDAEGKFEILGLLDDRKYLVRTGTRNQRDHQKRYSTDEARLEAGARDVKFVVEEEK